MSPLSVATAARNIAALRNRLRELGYTEGRNINIEYRFGDGLAERFPVLVADLVALKPAVIVVGSTAGVLAARKVTRTTPLIWFGSVDDPVALGLVESFARPGGNVTGFLLSNDASMVGKRLELLRDAVRGFSRVGAILNPEIAAVAASVRLPAIYTFREFVQAGGLMSYGADLPALYQRAAGYVDKILKGAKPGELPLQSSEKFELAVNLKTAKALNLTISEAFLLRADEVIE